MTEVGTLKELNVKPGDVVEYQGAKKSRYTVDITAYGSYVDKNTRNYLSGHPYWRIISRASDKPKIWKDMTPEEKGALLLAHYEGKVIEQWQGHDRGWKRVDVPSWGDGYAYRIRPEPKVEAVTLYGSVSKHIQWGIEQCSLDTHRITFNKIDGKPDCNSVKMEPLA